MDNKRNQYYLKFYVIGNQVVPKDSKLFYVDKLKLKYDCSYTMRYDNVGTKIHSIDCLTNQYFCEEELIESYFEGYDSEKNNIVVSVELVKEEGQTPIIIQPIYHAETLRPILNDINQKGKLYIDTNSYLYYVQQYFKWLLDADFKSYLLKSNKIGKKLKENVKNYNGNPDSQAGYLMRNMLLSYPVLRGTYIVASEYFKELKLEKEENRDIWHMLKEEQKIRNDEKLEMYQEMNYFEQLRYDGKIQQFYDGIYDGTLSLDDIPLSEELKDYYQGQIYKMKYSDYTEEEKQELQSEIYFNLEKIINEEFEQSIHHR